MGQRKKCKVCDSKKVAQINKDMRSGKSLYSLQKSYGISRATLKKHQMECLDSIVPKGSSIENSSSGTDLVAHIEEQIKFVDKMIKACDEYLTDPDDPEKYFLGARGTEIDIVYNERDPETGRVNMQPRKAALQELIDMVESDGRYVVRGISSSYSDPRDLLGKYMTKLEATAKMIYESTQKRIEWEHKKAALDKIKEAESNGATITAEKQIAIITERVIIARESSNTDELCEMANMPVLKNVTKKKGKKEKK